jgi:hypothetical protein
MDGGAEGLASLPGGCLATELASRRRGQIGLRIWRAPPWIHAPNANVGGNGIPVSASSLTELTDLKDAPGLAWAHHLLGSESF